MCLAAYFFTCYVFSHLCAILRFSHSHTTIASNCLLTFFLIVIKLFPWKLYVKSHNERAANDAVVIVGQSLSFLPDSSPRLGDLVSHNVDLDIPEVPVLNTMKTHKLIRTLKHFREAKNT